eukprot:4149620-Pyramimonas_sp.AAC.1
MPSAVRYGLWNASTGHHPLPCASSCVPRPVSARQEPLAKYHRVALQRPRPPQKILQVRATEAKVPPRRHKMLPRRPKTAQEAFGTSQESPQNRP